MGHHRTLKMSCHVLSQVLHTCSQYTTGNWGTSCAVFSQVLHTCSQHTTGNWGTSCAVFSQVLHTCSQYTTGHCGTCYDVISQVLHTSSQHTTGHCGPCYDVISQVLHTLIHRTSQNRKDLARSRLCVHYQTSQNDILLFSTSGKFCGGGRGVVVEGGGGLDCKLLLPCHPHQPPPPLW